MKVNDTNLSSLASTGTQQTERMAQTSRPTGAGVSSASSSSGDDIHLSELVRSLRSLAADSPERQARLEQIARSYANGSYKVDAEGTAAKMIDDGIQS
jgi:flagellar biosynthesis anti-sigma factor FlgM